MLCTCVVFIPNFPAIFCQFKFMHVCSRSVSRMHYVLFSICEVVIGEAQTLACKNPPRIHEASLNARNKPPKSRYKKISSAQLTEVEDSVCNFNFHSLSSINSKTIWRSVLQGKFLF